VVTAESCRLPPTQGLRAKKQTLYKRCAASRLRMGGDVRILAVGATRLYSSTHGAIAQLERLLCK